MDTYLHIICERRRLRVDIFVSMIVSTLHHRRVHGNSGYLFRISGLRSGVPVLELLERLTSRVLCRTCTCISL